MRARVVHRCEIAENTIMVEVEPEKKISFEPGQYMVLDLPNAKYSDMKGSTRVLSVASSPDEKTVSFATRLSGSAFKRSLNEMQIGEYVELKAVGGKLELPRDKRDIVMIAGGIGIAPFMSMLKSAWKKNKDFDITLFYSNRTTLSAAFIEELKSIAEKNKRLHLVLTMTREPRWEGELGRVSESLIKKYLKKPTTATFMIVGPGSMVSEISGLLIGMGVPRSQVLSESFTAG